MLTAYNCWCYTEILTCSISRLLTVVCPCNACWQHIKFAIFITHLPAVSCQRRSVIGLFMHVSVCDRILELRLHDILQTTCGNFTIMYNLGEVRDKDELILKLKGQRSRSQQQQIICCCCDLDRCYRCTLAEAYKLEYCMKLIFHSHCRPFPQAAVPFSSWSHKVLSWSHLVSMNLGSNPVISCGTYFFLLTKFLSYSGWYKATVLNIYYQFFDHAKCCSGK